MNRQKISIILATYNGEKLIGQLLDSIAGQTRRPDQITLRDDGSSDNTLNIASSWSQRENIPLVIISGERLGAAKSFLSAVSQSEPADIYFFADQDDVWLPHKIERAMGFLISGPQATPMLYASRLTIVDEFLGNLGWSDIPSVLSFRSAVCENVLTGCTMAFNYALANIIFSRHLPKEAIMHDWWLYLLASGVGTVVYDPCPTILYRQHSNNTIGVEARGLRLLATRISRLFKDDVTKRSVQLSEFLDIYKDCLHSEASSVAKSLVGSQAGFGVRVLSAVRSPIRRQRTFDAFTTRLSILFRKF